MRWVAAMALLAACGSEEVFHPVDRGPWRVGVQTLELEDPVRNRPLLVDVWYPIDPAERGVRRHYYIETSIGELEGFDSRATIDAPIIGGERPLILFSHGYGGLRFQSFFLTEHLASHGYVVAAPDHTGNRLSDFTMLGDDAADLQSAIDRPLDMLFVKAEIEKRFDVGRIGMSGHSFGAWTTFQVGSLVDDIDVFVPLAPGFREPSSPALARELDGRPVLILGGSVDHTTPPEEQQAAYDAALPPKALLMIEGAGHLDFSNLCDLGISQVFVDDGCDADAIPPEDVQKITNTTATAFFGRHLKENADYDPFLTDAFISELGPIEYVRE